MEGAGPGWFDVGGDRGPWAPNRPSSLLGGGLGLANEDDARYSTTLLPAWCAGEAEACLPL